MSEEICEKVGVMLAGEKGGSQLYGSVGMRVVMSLENHVHQLVSIPGRTSVSFIDAVLS